MAFRMYDCNGDGSIDVTEMRRIISVKSMKLASSSDRFLFFSLQGYLWVNWRWNWKTWTTDRSRRTCHEYLHHDGQEFRRNSQSRGIYRWLFKRRTTLSIINSIKSIRWCSRIPIIIRRLDSFSFFFSFSFAWAFEPK